MTQLDIKVTVRGGLFEKKIDSVVKGAMIDECMKQIQERLDRPPPKKKLGMQRNPTRTELGPGTGHEATLRFEHVESRFHSPRRTGAAWLKKNVAIIKGMAPRVLRKAADRIVSELS